MWRYLLAALLALSLGTTTARAADPLALAPREAEFLARIDMRQIVESGQFQTFMQSHAPKRIESAREAIRNLTDLDILEDIDAIYLFGRIDEDESVLFFSRGRFNQDKLLSLVKLNDTYEQMAMDGVTVHHWVDDGEKYGAFLEENLLVIAGSEAAMSAMMRTADDPGSGFLATPAADDLPENADEHAFWGMLVKTPGIDCDFGNFARSIDLQSVVMLARFAPSAVETRMIATPDSPGLLDEYEEAAQGAMAAARLLKEEEEWARLLSESATVERSANRNRLEMTASIPNNTFFEFLNDQMD